MTAEMTGLAGPRAVETPVAATPAVTPLQAWISQLLQCRGHKAPAAQPLHRYQLTAQERAALKALLRDQRAHLEHPSWAACFCLCAAESYRREHEGAASAFDWNALEESLECPLEDEPRAQLIETGLAYWKRPPLAREDATGLAAMLSREGGLPWKLVQSHEAEIDAAIRQALRRFHLTAAAGQTSAGLLAECAQQLPAVFRGLDTRELLARMLEQLVLLAREHPLADQPDAAAYLDQHAPGWRATFPVPADEPEAGRLLGRWLGEAAARQQQQAAAAERVPGCRHRLLEGTSSRWHLVAELSLPAEDSFSVDLKSLSSTRLVATVYEGERLALNAGTVHAVAHEEGLKVQYPPQALVVERQNLREPLSLRLLESGRAIHVLPFEGSSFDVDELPLVFESRDEEQWLVASASCSVAASEVLIRVPPGAQHDPASERFAEEGGARWIKASRELTIRHGGDVYNIELKRTGPAPETPALQGTRAQLPAGPGRAFLGWPGLAPSGETGEAESSEAELFIGDEPLDTHTGLVAGSVLVSVRSPAGDTLHKERISVLPPGLALSVVPASGDSPAKVIVTGAAGATWALSGAGISASGESADDPLEIPLTPQGGPPPAWLNLELGSSGQEPVILPLAYPHPGARLIDQSGRESRARDLTLEELRDARIVLAPASASGQELHLQLDLLASGSIGLRHHHIIRVGDSPAVISLGGYLGQIQQMLGSVDDPDAYVRLAVETDQPLLQINIRRFGALLEEEGGKYRLSDITGGSARSGVVARALPFSPGSSLTLSADADAEDVFNAAALTGSWLIYPGVDSSIRFRPEIHTGEGGAEPPVSSALLQPVADAALIDPLLKSMAADLDHEGWQRLDELKTSLRHLPLATFQAWRSISRQPDALAAALLRLSADERFCGRIHDELAVLWEAIPVETWVKACARFRSWAGAQGLMPAQLSGLLENRQRLLQAVVPGLDSTGDYLSRGQRAALKKPPIELVLPYHYQELRRTHQANARWPTELAAPLSTWLDRQRLPRVIKKLSNTAYSDAVTYLPIFMAHVTAGKASLSTLPGDPAYVRLVIRKISEFDRGWYLYVHSLLVSYLLAADS